jgi:hypothetical protein
MAPYAKEQKEWARLGAATRLAQLRQEVAAILRAYPDLRRGVPAAAAASGTRPKRVMSAKARAAMSEGMRKYWAKRKGSGR